MLESNSFVYALIDPRTMLIRYIGKTEVGLRRIKSHLKPSELSKPTHCAAWKRQLKSLGLTPIWVVLQYAQGEQLDQAERWWIAYGKISCWLLTNLTEGGEGALGYAQTEKQRAEKSISHKAWANRPEIREQHVTRGKQQWAAMSDEKRQSELSRLTEVRALGQARSIVTNKERLKNPANNPANAPGAREKISRAAKLRESSPAINQAHKVRAKKMWESGKLQSHSQTSNTRQKISNGNKGKVRTPEQRAKVSAGLKAYHRTKKNQP